MDPELIHSAVVWAALGLGLGCLVLRLIPRRPPEPSGQEQPGD